MDKHYLIFHQEGFDFALDPTEFSHHVKIEALEISPCLDQRFAWQFESETQSGQLVHFGQLMGFSPFGFSKEGQIFFFKQEDNNASPIGLYIENVVGYLDKSSLKKPKKESTELKRLPEKMPTTTLGWYLPWRGRKFLLVEEHRILTVFRLYNHIKPLAIKQPIDFGSPATPPQ